MIKWIKRLFNKENKLVIPETKVSKDYENYIIKLNMKTLCLFEKITGKNGFHYDEEDVLYLIYASLMVNNDISISFNVFTGMLDRNEKFARCILRKYLEASKIYQELKPEEIDENIVVKEEDNKALNETNVLTSVNKLIVWYGIDPHYVMYEMDMWELKTMFKEIDEYKKNELAEQRLWTYLTMAPHMDSKKIKGPEDILPFEWEKTNNKEKALQDLNNKTEMIKGVFDYFKKLKEETIDNGETDRQWEDDLHPEHS